MLKVTAIQTIFINYSLTLNNIQKSSIYMRQNLEALIFFIFHDKKDNSCSLIKPGVLLIVVFHQSSINTELFTQYPVDRKNFGGLQSNRMLASFLDLLLSHLRQDRKVTYYDKYAQKKMCSSILYTP